ncbi:hypothetical protein [Bacillus pseudomycoides]|uniref:hypothetical protein n=1 Tax=Bacillus pseudomycoides TaxID=64104 RepID=UPI000BF950CC|nr:hypothetical protein [Bacillus pseudomycoides]PGD30533.1 hypothetical protein COM30_17860 [Bacillus pseudomycoides]PHC91996.1 hypothetical protein COF36_22475 [Bacillus pseudomycoides]PHF46120.1 hypothetical protein COF72_13125 [Bacillus pseudomycoides]
MENKTRAEEIVNTFINSCKHNGIPLEKGWGLFDEMMNLVEQGVTDEKVWKALTDKTIKEAQNEAGVML